MKPVRYEDVEGIKRNIITTSHHIKEVFNRKFAVEYQMGYFKEY